MILLNKFINPTLATGKILQSYWQYIISGELYLYSVNIGGLYLNTCNKYNLFTYPVSDNFGMVPIENRVYTHFEKGTCRFTRIIYKNNKKVEISNNTCEVCFMKATYLMIGKNTQFVGMRKYDHYCVDCKLFASIKLRNLFDITEVIKDYTQYYNSY